ncbi:MAG: hypothetical protein ACOYXM_07605 [Actinomycetota bacterium]
MGDRDDLTKTEHHLALAIATYASATGIAWPGRERLARDTRSTTRTVERTLAKLVAKGVLKIKTPGGGRGRATVYELHDPGKGDSPVAVSAPRTATQPTAKGDTPRPKGVAGSPQEVGSGIEVADGQSVDGARAQGWRDPSVDHRGGIAAARRALRLGHHHQEHRRDQ